ncbi:MAG: hypothetical protein VW999_05285 [Alphaproteobacteria bacterium]
MTRTTLRTVTFKKPLVLRDHDEVLPAGTYRVETDEEPISGISFLAYRRTQTILHLLPRHGLRQSLAIDPDDLVAALDRDHAAENHSTPSSEHPVRRPAAREHETQVPRAGNQTEERRQEI